MTARPAAELHIRADLGVVDAAEQALRPELLAGLRGRQAAGRPGEREARGRYRQAKTGCSKCDTRVARPCRATWQN
jgi:hypothetical protein